MAISFPDILQQRAQEQAERLAFEFVKGDELQGATLTYGELDREVRKIAAGLAPYAITDTPVLIMMPPGLKLIAAFLAVISLRGIASLVEPSFSLQQKTIIKDILTDLEPELVLVAEEHVADAATISGKVKVLSTESFAGLEPLPAAQFPPISGVEPCLVQYTSGSSGTPKGVVLSHANLMRNSEVIQQSFFHTSKSYGVIWLPPYHDMGLIGGILQPLFTGFPVTLLSPRTFLQKPVRLLRLISAKKATTSGGPNFAYELCTKKITDEELEGIDLRSWQVAFCGSEPVQEQTLSRFAKRFAKQNFQNKAFLPCYGLAESTLYVTGVLKLEEPLVLYMDRKTLGQGLYSHAKSPGEGVAVVSCGFPYYQETVLVVNPDTKALCRTNEIGEVWVASPCNALGYWRKDGNDEIFHATLAKPDGKQYLRTGDLGFFHRNQLFVTGRIKDMIILNGKNHFPQDIEQTVKHAFAAWPEWKEAFPVATVYRSAEQEHLAVILEIPKKIQNINTQSVIERIRAAITETHHIQPGMILLVPSGEILRTRNGKLQRYQISQDLALGNFDEIASWKNDLVTLVQPSDGTLADPDLDELTDIFLKKELAKTESMVEMQEILIRWMAKAIATEIEMPAEEIDPELHFGLYGLDSISAVVISTKLEKLVGEIEVSPTILWDYPNLKAISWHIAGLIKEKNPLLI